MSNSPPESPSFESRFRVRSYELDSFGHVNHAIFFNYLEQARFEALARGGFTYEEFARRGWSVVVVRAEADFKREALLGDELTVLTRMGEVGRTSMVLHHEIVRARDGERLTRASVVAVWLGPDRRPIRVPDEVRAALADPDLTS